MMNKILISTIIFLCWISTIKAQTYVPISTQGTIVSCIDTLVDSGGNAGGYGPNEDYTITVCSDGTGNNISFNFALGGASTIDIHPTDTLYIYDGDNISAPLIGAYNNSNLTFFEASSLANTSTCLTFHFVSDGSSEGTGWQAGINCGTVCQPFEPIVTTNPIEVNLGPDSVYTNICPGDTISFSATANYPYSGFGSNYNQSDATSTFSWNFGNGQLSPNQSDQANFINEGGYLVELIITDVNGCTESVYHRVRTGLTPSFSDISSSLDTACFGDTVNLLGGFDQANGQPIGNSPNTGYVTAGGIVSGQTFLPDGSGTSYSTDVVISGFPMINVGSASDIAQVCMNIEHSYIGDLTIELACPNGTSIVLSDNYNNGTGAGNTFLGDALDDGGTNPGIGYEYCFDLGAVWGTLDDENVAGNYIPATLSAGNNSLSPGIYQPEGNFADFIGCPIDGSWTITVTDNIGSDNGYIFEWGIELNPEINPNSEEYEVAIVDGYWVSDPTIFVSTDSTASATDIPQGSTSYIYEIIDEYGCKFDTTIVVQSYGEIGAYATPDTAICQGSVPLFITDTNVTVSTCDYTIELFDTFSDGWNGGSLDVIVNGVNIGNFTLPTGSGSTESFTVTDGDNIEIIYNSGAYDTEVSYNILNGAGTNIFSDGPGPTIGSAYTGLGDCGGNAYDYLWTPATDLSSATDPDPTFTGTPGTYTYQAEIFFTEYPQCSAISNTITIDVQNLPPPNLIGDTLLCLGQPFDLLLDDGENIDWGNGDTTLNNSFTPIADTSLSIAVSVGACNFVVEQDLFVNPLPTSNVSIVPNTICFGDSILPSIISPTGVTATWDNGMIDNQMYSTTASGYLVATSIDTLGCIGQDSVMLTVNPNPVLSSNVTSICTFEQDSLEPIFLSSSTGGTTYTSLSPGQNLIPDTLLLTQGVFAIEGTDLNGCKDTIEITVNIMDSASIHSDTTIVIEQEVELWASHPDSNASYNWSPAFWLDCSTCDYVNLTPDSTGTFIVLITDTNGCEQTLSVVVEVLYPDLFIPTGFSPNGDLNNDFFQVYGLGFVAFDLQIFDRWGNLVFSATDPDNHWDGTYKGSPLNKDVFVYKLNASLQNGEIIEKSGNLTLFR